MTSDELFPLYTAKRNQAKWMVDIDNAYLQSNVSYYGLRDYVPDYKSAYFTIRGSNFDISRMSESRKHLVIESCAILYGLLHQRFILTEEGMYRVEERYKHAVYGRCPRPKCNNQHLLPYGETQEPGKCKAKAYCLSCHDIYDTSVEYDGAYFGPDFPIMYHMMMEIPFKTKFKLFDFNYTGTQEEQERIKRLHDKNRIVRWAELKE